MRQLRQCFDDQRLAYTASVESARPELHSFVGRLLKDGLDFGGMPGRAVTVCPAMRIVTSCRGRRVCTSRRMLSPVVLWRCGARARAANTMARLRELRARPGRGETSARLQGRAQQARLRCAPKPRCSITLSLPPARSAICTAVASDAVRIFRANTTKRQATQPLSVSAPTLHLADQHKHEPTREFRPILYKSGADR
jgi:hypothetical protein